MSKYVDRARELRALTEVRYNCAQAVLVPFAEEIGLDPETAFRVSANFGGGMKMGSVCGAVTGALMALGLAGLDSPDLLQEIYSRVRENHEGKLDCRDLLRINAQKGLPKRPHCDQMIFELIGITEELLVRCGKLQ